MRRIVLLLSVAIALVGVSASIASAHYNDGHEEACSKPGPQQNNPHCQHRNEGHPSRAGDDVKSPPDDDDDGNSGDEGFTDGDALRDGRDNCPNHWNPDQKDSDGEDGEGDGIGDACDPDRDDDGVPNDDDNCPGTANPTQSDRDRDGTGDACDRDANGNDRPDRVDDAVDTANDTAEEGQSQATAARRQAVRAASNVADEVFEHLSD